MKTDFKIDGKGILSFLKSRRVVLENSQNLTVFNLQLLWFLMLMIFFSGIIVVGLIVSLFLGCKISIVETKTIGNNSSKRKLK